MAVNPDGKGAARLARPGAAFKRYWVLFIGNITAAQPFEYSQNYVKLAGRSSELVRLVHPVGTQFRRPGTVARFRVF